VWGLELKLWCCKKEIKKEGKCHGLNVWVSLKFVLNVDVQYRPLKEASGSGWGMGALLSGMGLVLLLEF
jgi:hypothetical protein